MLYDNLEGWNGVGGGREVQEGGDICILMADSCCMAESEEELKRFLMKVKVESEKVGLKLNIQETKTMACGPITSWKIDGETVETVAHFIFGGLQNH